MASNTVNGLRDLEPNIWKACAGSSVQIPTVDSMVYYFPQGHAEQSSSPPDFSSLVCKRSFVLCRIVSVRFLANPHTDEVFVKIRLEPVDRSRAGIRCVSPAPAYASPDGDGGEVKEKFVSFAKILTPSDANNGGGFSVPRFCADSIYPPLNYKADPPVQTISVRDVHGVVWEFRHIYRGTPRRHLLTTGWSKFVNQKKLVAGDSVVFMKNRSGELFVGVRRTARSGGSVNCVRWNCQFAVGASVGVKSQEEFRHGEGFSRSSTGRIPAESVVEATELAGAGRPFEIVCYPRAGLSDFVVKAETVEDSLKMFWTAGMRVKMAVETEDSSRMTWFQGTVSSAGIPDHGPWPGSPWRMLQVTWDEPEVLQDVKRVSPWQVELVAATPPLQTLFSPTKKFRVSQNSDILTDGGGAPSFPMTGLTNSMMGNFSPSLFNYNTFPAGMQGARHDSFSGSSLPHFVASNTHHMLYSDNFYGNMGPKLSSVSTELSIGSASQSDNSSPHSQSSVHFSGTELFGNRTTKSRVSTFQLFGKIIQTNHPVESGSDDAGCSEDDGSKEYKETEGVTNPLDPSLRYPYNKLYDGLNVQC